MKVTNDPLISIITVVYNSAATLEQTILSVINQTYKNIEYIIIDGGSTDGSVDIIRKYQDRLAFWKSEKDKGIYYAMNDGLNLSTGSLVGILNSDDWYELNTIELIVKNSLEYPNVDVFHGLLKFINKDGSANLIRGHYSNSLDNVMIEHPTCFIKRSVYHAIGGYNTHYRSASDYDFMVKVRKRGFKFLLVPSLLCNFRMGGASDSLLSAKEEIEIKLANKFITKGYYYYVKAYIFVIQLLRIRK